VKSDFFRDLKTFGMVCAPIVLPVVFAAMFLHGWTTP